MGRILIAAGGTGGHVFPAVATGRILRSRGHQVHFAVKLDASTPAYLAREGFASSAFAFEGFPRRWGAGILSFPFAALSAWACAERMVRRERPDVVLGMGGYITVPVGLAAARRKIPLCVHEQNRQAGLANRLLARWARTVATAFEGTRGFSPRRPTVCVGLPLRDVLTRKVQLGARTETEKAGFLANKKVQAVAGTTDKLFCDDKKPGFSVESREPTELFGLTGLDASQARARLGLDPRAPTFLFFGGSQGAHGLNAAILAAVAVWARERPDCQYIHLTGERDRLWAEETYRTLGARAFVRGFFPDMPTVYAAADFAVTRAGANTVRELFKIGLEAFLVPYPHACDDHQAANAQWLAERGAAAWARENNMDLVSVWRTLPAIDALRRKKAERADRPSPDDGAAERLAACLEALL